MENGSERFLESSSVAEKSQRHFKSQDHVLMADNTESRRKVGSHFPVPPLALEDELVWGEG